MSMRAYARISPTFWIGETGREIRALGRDATLIALYLISAPLSTMTGLYYLPLTTLCHETGVDLEVARSVLDALGRIGFAHYDYTTEHVWVPNMAHFQVGASLKVKDRRVEGIVNQLRPLRGSPFLPAFIERYARAFKLAKAKGWRELTQALRSPSNAPSKDVPGPMEGPSKDHKRGSSQEQEQYQEQKQDQDQDKKQGKEGGDDPAPPTAAPTSSSSGPTESAKTPEKKAEKLGAESSDTPHTSRVAVADPEALRTAWNTHAPNLIPCHALTPTRFRLARARLAERPAIAEWVAVFQRMNASSFLRGFNDRKWRADFDFALRAETCVHVAEGRYDLAPSAPAVGSERLAEARRRFRAGEDPR
jgi:hypothetical protein